MVSSLEQTKRSAIAEKLADMRAIQNLLITDEQQFLSECNDQDICDRLEDMLEDDRKNLQILETVITEYGIQSQPKEKIQKMVEQVQSKMRGSELSLYEKMVEHELLKHGQVMSGLVVHKAAQVSEMDMKQPIAPLNTLNFDNRSHQEQLKGILEVLGTRELTGKEAEQGVWGRVQDAIAGATGALGSAVSRTMEKLDILQIIRTDHIKVKTIIGEIRSERDPQKLRELVGQRYADLKVHTEAEKAVFYPKLRSFYEDTQELYDEHAQLEQALEEAKSMDPSSSELKPKIMQIKHEVDEHTSEEESSVFSKARQNMSKEQLQQLGREFKETKQQLQSKMSS